MCDYSLGGIPNRLAVEGDQLVLNSFRTGTIGLASVGDVESVQEAARRRKTIWDRVKALCSTQLSDVPAVCIPPGATLELNHVPRDMQLEFGLKETEVVRFTQTSMHENQHRDAFRFPRGNDVLLQRLKPGLHVTVLSLGGATPEVPAGLPEEVSV